MGPVVGPAADLGGRLGEDRKAGDAGEVDERLAQPRVELAPGDDHPRERLVDVLRDLLEQELGRLEVDRGHSGQGSLVAAPQRQLVGRRHRPLDRDRRQRLPPRQVEVDRARARLPARGGESPAGGRAVVQKPVVVCGVGPDFAEPPHRGPVELDLVDRLTGADVPQLRRPVGAERDQRDRREVGLADGGVEVRRRGAGGAEDGDRGAARLGGAEREVGGRALVDDHRHVDLRPAPERDRQRRRSRAG